MEEEKMKGILDWLTPQGVKDIQKFLELENYYYWFIKDFATIAKLLYNMIRKNQEWKWTEKQETVFRVLKERFTKELTLAAPELRQKKIRIEVNASDYATREVLPMDVMVQDSKCLSQETTLVLE